MRSPQWVSTRLFLCIGSALLVTLAHGEGWARRHHHEAPKPEPVILTTQPNTPLETTARFLNKDILNDAAQHHDRPVILVGSASLSKKKSDRALFVQIQSARLCGAAGCTTSVYRQDKSSWITILDSVSGSIAILPTRHHGMADLLVDGNDRWIWNGKTYQDTLASTP